MLFFQQKKSPFFFISRSGFLSVFFSLSFTGLSPIFSFSLSFSLSIFQICGHEIINLSLILNTTRIQKQFPLSVFVFIDSLVVSALQDAGGYAISCQNNLELHLGCHAWWLSYFTLLCLWCGRTVGWTYDHAITKISRMDRLPHFLRYGATLARVELRYKETNRPFAIANHVINFLQTWKQFAFGKFCEQELKEHIKIK